MTVMEAMAMSLYA